MAPSAPKLIRILCILQSPAAALYRPGAYIRVLRELWSIAHVEAAICMSQTPVQTAHADSNESLPPEGGALLTLKAAPLCRGGRHLLHRRTSNIRMLPSRATYPLNRIIGCCLFVVAEACPLRPRLRSHGAASRLRCGWTARWSMRRIMASVTMASDTSGRCS